MASVAVSVNTICPLLTWNCLASVSTRKTRTKKSNASSIQPRKPAVTECQGRDDWGSEWVVSCWSGIGMGCELEEHGSGRNAMRGSNRRIVLSLPTVGPEGSVRIAHGISNNIVYPRLRSIHAFH